VSALDGGCAARTIARFAAHFTSVARNVNGNVNANKVTLAPYVRYKLLAVLTITERNKARKRLKR
jgi:hypothetical protein